MVDTWATVTFDDEGTYGMTHHDRVMFDGVTEYALVPVGAIGEKVWWCFKMPTHMEEAWCRDPWPHDVTCGMRLLVEPGGTE